MDGGATLTFVSYFLIAIFFLSIGWFTTDARRRNNTAVVLSSMFWPASVLIVLVAVLRRRWLLWLYRRSVF